MIAWWIMSAWWMAVAAWWPIVVSAFGFELMRTFALVGLIAVLVGFIVDRGTLSGWITRKRTQQTLPKFAYGQWRSTDGSNELVVDRDLTWQWTSTWQGRWRGSGRGEVHDARIVLVGFRDGFDPLGKPYPHHRIEITLERHDDRLEGSIQTLFVIDVKFVRDESARAQW